MKKEFKRHPWMVAVAAGNVEYFGVVSLWRNFIAESVLRTYTI